MHSIDDKAPTMLRAAIYARVSTDRQDMDRQLVELREYAVRAGHQVVEEVREQESGAKAGRSGLSRLQELAHQRKIDVILVWEMSRLTRRGIGPLLEILKGIQAQGVAVISLREPFLSTSGPTRDLLLAIFAWVAEQEREMIRDRTRSALKQRKALGVQLGAERLCECGHRRKALKRDGGRLVHNPDCSVCPCTAYDPGMRGGHITPTVEAKAE
ncbi:MAG: recombinase family protein [Thermoplasmata archaeon]|nr:recombinase family protein [Thermoplasmata archaeon]